MDELNSSFGRLSTSAAEWRPGQNQLSTVNTKSSDKHQSDLSAFEVKEFIPGKGWSSNSPQNHINLTQHPTLNTHEQHSHDNNLQYGTTLPFGQSPPPLPQFRSLHSLGITDDIWRHYRDISLESIRQMEPSDPRHKAVPLPYCNAYSLDSTHRGRSSFGYPSATFQVVSREDGHLYCLRRYDSVKSVSPRIAAAVAERWTSCAPVREHPGVVPLYRCFVAQRAVFFVYQYIPGARSLELRLGGPLSEPCLWSAIAQLVSALRTIHANGLAARTLDLQHVLSNADSTATRLRLRINCLGIVDTLEFEARKNVSDLQQEDIRNLGRLILSLATGTELTAVTDNDTMGHCEAFLAQHYSRDLHNLAMTLIKSAPRPPSIVDVSRAVAQRSFDEQDATYQELDRIEQALSAEYDSGRALRLLLKLGFIIDRPENGQNRRWAQSGDCYVLTLFRDFVFHQADGAGRPVMDLGHVVTSLNKLDAADEEKVVLSSRDGKSLMLVSYADVSRCLENAFHELLVGSIPPVALQY